MFSVIGTVIVRKQVVTSQSSEDLQSRIAELETENANLRSHSAPKDPPTKRKNRLRGGIAVTLILVGALLAPVAVLGSWARVQLVDTTTFVDTFAPLSANADVQSFVSDQVVIAVNDSIDIDGLVATVFAGISRLGLPEDAAMMLQLLQSPAAQGVRGMIDTGVREVVASPQFSKVWEVTLRETHSRAISLIQGDPDTVLQLSQDGTLSLELGQVINEVKATLETEGFGLASAIPEVDRSITIVASDSLALVRSLYQLAVTAGYWLPWVVFGCIAGGIAVAVRRSRAVMWSGIAVALSILTLIAGVGLGKSFFIAEVSPTIMSAETATVIFHQLTGLISATTTSVLIVAVLVAAAGWVAGTSRSATHVRSACSKFVLWCSSIFRRGNTDVLQKDSHDSNSSHAKEINAAASAEKSIR